MKKHTLTLDLDIDNNPLLDDIAILLFQTDTPGYLLADDLNHLYHLALSRVDDIGVLDTSWPLYIYHSQLEYLDYYLVDLSAAQTANQTIAQSKTLIIRGEDAIGTAHQILNDFTQSPAPQHPLAFTSANDDILLSYQQALTPVNLYNPQPTATLSRKAAKDMQELDNLFTSIIDYLDLHHL